MRFYSRVAALLLRQVDRAMPKLSFNVNSRDTMVVVAVRPAEPPAR
jgi:hypothetical protein